MTLYRQGMESNIQWKKYIGKNIVSMSDAGHPLSACVLILGHLIVDAAFEDKVAEKDGLLAVLVNILRRHCSLVVGALV